MTPGRFITLEGGEGVGKTTQRARLAGAIRGRGYQVIETREPGGTPGAEAIRALLMTGAIDRWSPRVEALLFAAARADHVERVIRPALDAGSWVVCDRFVDSTRAYQGAAGTVSDADILALHRIGSCNLLPDRSLLLTVPASDSEQRLVARGNRDRMGDRHAAFYARVDQGFRCFAQAEPERWRVVDAAGSVEAVTTRLVEAIEDLL